jgi:hypothetical protein
LALRKAMPEGSLQMKNRNGLGAMRIHEYSGIILVVAPLVRKLREEHDQRSKPIV